MTPNLENPPDISNGFYFSVDLAAAVLIARPMNMRHIA